MVDRTSRTSTHTKFYMNSSHFWIFYRLNNFIQQWFGALIISYQISSAFREIFIFINFFLFPKIIKIYGIDIFVLSFLQNKKFTSHISRNCWISLTKNEVFESLDKPWKNNAKRNKLTYRFLLTKCFSEFPQSIFLNIDMATKTNDDDMMHC